MAVRKCGDKLSEEIKVEDHLVDVLDLKKRVRGFKAEDLSVKMTGYSGESTTVTISDKVVSADPGIYVRMAKAVARLTGNNYETKPEAGMSDVKFMINFSATDLATCVDNTPRR